MFEGVHTALVTPLRDGAVDEPALRELVERQIAAGIDGLVPCGSTGESATLSHAEHRRVVELVVEAAAGRAIQRVRETLLSLKARVEAEEQRLPPDDGCTTARARRCGEQEFLTN